MQIRVRQSGAVMYESEFRAYQKANGGPSWETTTTEVLEALGADVVLEGAQATGGTVYQYSQASGVEQIDLFKIHHFDNKNRRVSLKRLEFEMDLENIEEMPIHHTKIGLKKA